MPEEKRSSYSLISVEKAPDDEVIVVDSSGVHTEGVPASVEEAPSFDDAESSYEGGKDFSSTTEESPKKKPTGASSTTSTSASRKQESALDGLTEEDLEAPVPMQRMHALIIALVLVGLVAFILYFFVLR